jgi:hypothetical protein
MLCVSLPDCFDQKPRRSTSASPTRRPRLAMRTIPPVASARAGARINSSSGGVQPLVKRRSQGAQPDAGSGALATEQEESNLNTTAATSDAPAMQWQQYVRLSIPTRFVPWPCLLTVVRAVENETHCSPSSIHSGANWNNKSARKTTPLVSPRRLRRPSRGSHSASRVSSARLRVS